ncbi:glutathione transferase GstA [Aminobacter aganoensis]|uniref:Glutathione S-transferase n=1 Tax=Aminobacter aganoensis TaxID=83264 RepID=A0A7X0KMQ5_9HYPH|nr:glutathione transferase GstA [Aminobacter aganoensis]MBB6356294.1 glutathione S-transferase [Aminobacter aganoensis]
MKLFYATGTCSLSPHIVALEAGIALDIERVDIFRKPHITAGGHDFTSVNPNGYVPALELDDGSLLTEGAAIVQYLADLRPALKLAPETGTRERYQLQSWLNFVATELHKMYSPWLFHPEYGVQAQEVARAKIGERLAYVEKHLEGSGSHLMGENFTVADAYLFTIVGWSAFAKVDLSAFPRLRAYMGRVGARPKVREAMLAEGMKLAA